MATTNLEPVEGDHVVWGDLKLLAVDGDNRKELRLIAQFLPCLRSLDRLQRGRTTKCRLCFTGNGGRLEKGGAGGDPP